MRLLLVAWFAVSSLSDKMSCTPARSRTPLSDPAKAKLDPQLTGTWRAVKDGHEIYVHVFGYDSGQFDLVLVGDNGKDGAGVLHYQGHVSEGGYLNLREKTFADPTADPFELSKTWLLGRYDIGADGTLVLSWMGDELVGEAIAAGKLAGAGKEINDKPAAILAFIKRSDAKALWTPLDMKFTKLKRPK